MVAYAFTLLSLLAVVAVHLTWLPVPVQAAGHSFTNLIGQEHRWTMFSADPRGIAIDLWAEVEREDGSVTRWQLPRGVAGGELRSYRWIKWAELAVLGEAERQLGGFAEWLVEGPPLPVTRLVIYGTERGPGDVGAVRPAATVRVLYVWPDGPST